MTKLQCPRCGKQGISFLRKMCLGPVLSTRCRECGEKVGVPGTAMLAFIPFGGAILAAEFAEPFVLKAALWVVGFVLMSVIDMCWVPLEPR